MDSKSLPNGFITVEEAVELIKSDTRDDAKVDTQYLVSHIDWIEEAHNFRIPLVRLSTKEEIEAIRKRYPGRRPSGLTSLGSKTVTIMTAWEKELLKKTIREHYKEMVGRDYEKPTVRGLSSVSDEENSGGTVKPRRSSKTIAKEGETIGSGQSRVTNSADGAGL